MFTLKNRKTGFVSNGSWRSMNDVQDFILFVIQERPNEIKGLLGGGNDFNINDIEIVEKKINDLSTPLTIVDLGEVDETELKTLDDDSIAIGNFVKVKSGRKIHLFEVKRLNSLGFVESFGKFQSKESAQHFIDNFDEEADEE